jgi:hypothetical protein
MEERSGPLERKDCRVSTHGRASAENYLNAKKLKDLQVRYKHVPKFSKESAKYV